MYSTLFYLCLILVIILLYNPDFLPNNFWKSKAFYNSVTKEYTTEKKGKRRVFCFALGIAILLPLYFLQMNENYLEKEYFIEEQNKLEQEEQNKVNLEKVRQEKINTLEEFGIANVEKLTDNDIDFLIDSLENITCREIYITKIQHEFNIKRINLSEGVDAYNVNKDCEQAKILYNSLLEEKEKKEELERAVTIRQLIRDYRDNTVAANNKYKGDVFLLKGCIIKEIDQNMLGILIEFKTSYGNIVECNMSDDEETISSLRRGQRINIYCTVYSSQLFGGVLSIDLEKGTIY